MNDMMQIQQQTMATTAFSNAESFEAAQRMAKALCSSSLVPQHYRGADNIGNAIIALEMAQRMNAAPLLIMQNLYLVHGNPGWSAKFLIATFNQSGRFEPISYEWKGEPGADDYGCRAVSKFRATGKDILGPWIDWALVKAEGWHSKSGSKWKTMPEKMFRYRAAAWMIDTVAPELSMGLPTAEDISDYIDVNPRTGEVITPQSTASTLEAALSEARPKQDGVTFETLMKAIECAIDDEELSFCQDMARPFDGRTKEGKAIAEALDKRAEELANADPEQA